MVFATRAAKILFVLIVPLAIILTTVRLMVFDAGLYERGYQRHGVARTTGMTRDQLAQATAEIQAFFRGGLPVSLVLEKEWGPEPLFNAREQQHLADVRSLLDLTWLVQGISLGVLLALCLALSVRLGRLAARRLMGLVAAGAGLTLALFLLLGALALSDFNTLWTRFHMLSFANDLWLLDPRTDYMIRLYPLDFWSDAVLEFVLRSIAAAVALLAVTLASRRWLPVARVSPEAQAPLALDGRGSGDQR